MKKPYDQQTEEELMVEVVRNDLQAFDELTGRLQPRLYAFARRHLKQEAAAEDVTQEALLRLFKYRQRYEEGKRVSTWVFTFALNLCRDWYRTNGRTSSMTDDATALAAEHSRFRRETPDPLDIVEAREMAELLTGALEELPESTRRLLKLRGQEDLTFEEAGKRLGMKPDAARAAASRAYKKLKKFMQDRMKNFEPE